jgi:acylpyruvate hydrolase
VEHSWGPPLSWERNQQGKEMRIVRFKSENGTRLGVVKGNNVIDIASDWADRPSDLAALLKRGPDALKEMSDLANRANGNQVRPFSEIKPAIPVERPGKFLCLGLNYADHVAESTHAQPKYPILFMRAPTSLVAHGEAIVAPSVSDNLDYEAELAVIIGRTMRHVSPEQALDGVAGYTCFNDGSVRDFQRHTTQWTMGKNFDRTGGFGPVFVTADELPRGAIGLKIETRVNGETRQSNNTSNMIFNVADSISYISQGMTLEPGDVIAMGTSSGVAAAHKPPKWLRSGDVVEIDIEKIGILSNTVANEKSVSREAAA